MSFLQRIFGNGQKKEERTAIPYGFFKYRLRGGRLVRAYNPPPVVIAHYDEKGRPHSRTVASPFGIVFPAPTTFALGGREVRLDPKQPLYVVDLPSAQGRIMNLGGALVADSEHGLWDGDVSYGS